MNITHSERERYDGVGINGVLAVKGAGDGWTDKIEKEEIRPEETRFYLHWPLGWKDSSSSLGF